MKTSVIIPTYNGRRKVGNVLRALAQQTQALHEVIVVIDGSTDGTETYLKETDFGMPFTIHVQENRGRAAVRNKGAQLATGDLLVFFDDDMRPVPDCLARHLHHHGACPGSILGGAQLEEPATMRTDIQRYKAHLSRKWTEPFAECREPLPPDRLFLTAANFSIPAALFRQLDGFDERLTDAEDFDLAVRASCAEIPIYFRQEAIAWHDDFITCRSYVKRLRQYQLAHGKLHQLKPDLYRRFNQYAYHRVGGFKKLTYNLTAAPWIVNLIDSGGLRLLPRKLRYKLYDIVTTGSAVHFPDREL
jgi:glycosyltransferase involved in cell wall biosynthesis